MDLLTANLLETYKGSLDEGTFEGLRYKDEEKSRFVSFQICVSYLKSLPRQGKVLELGTCRSYVDGKYEGCNSDDKKYWNPSDHSMWDWGAGCFSLLMSSLAGAEVTSVDIVASHVERCKHMAGSLGLKSFHNVVSDSVKFLADTPNKYDVIYLDTGDMWPIEPTCELQRIEAVHVISRDLLEDDGLLIIDDVLNGTPREQGDASNKYGKSELSIPYLEANGYEAVYKGYQYIYKKRK